MFDIDKIFISTLFRSSDGSIEFKNNPQKQAANDLVTAYLAILKDSDRSFAELNGSIDNDAELIKEVVRDIFGKQAATVMPYAPYTMKSQFSSKDEFINGKRGIGPYALNNNNHVLTMLYGVKFAEIKNGIMTRLGLTSLYGANDRYGESIMSWLSGFINAHVDVAKDPYISKLNVNPYTYNLVSLLIRTGYGKDTLYFTSQPIMRQLAEAYSNATGKYMVDKSVRQYKLTKEAEDTVLLNLVNDLLGKKYDDLGKALEDWKSGFGIDVEDAIVELLKNQPDIMRDIAKRQVKDIVNDDTLYELLDNKVSTADIQILIALANRKFAPYATALSQLVQYSKIDTKKEGKSIVEQTKYLAGYDAMHKDDGETGSRELFDKNSLRRFFDNSYIDKKTRNATETFLSILGEQMIEGTEEFQFRLAQFLSRCPNLSDSDIKALKSASNALLAKIKSDYFFGQNGYAKKLGVNVTGLVSGNNTIYDRLLKIKCELSNNPVYRDMVDQDGNPLNYLLRNLVSGNKYEFRTTNVAAGTMEDTYAHAKFVKPLSFMNDESVSADELSQAWDDLLRDTAHPELQKFAQDLVVYAFITSGDNGGRQDIFRYVPNSWKLGIEELGESYEGSYAEFMQQTLIDFQNNHSGFTFSDFDDIILNNWHDDRFVPTVYPFRKGVKQFEEWSSHPTQGFPIVLGGINANGEAFDSNALYIKMKRYHIGGTVNGQRDYTIYRRFGFGVRQVLAGVDKNGQQIFNSVTYPIYVMVDPKGVKFSNTDYVLGYGQQSAPEASYNVRTQLSSLIDVVNSVGGNVKSNTIAGIIQELAEFANSHGGIKAIDLLQKYGLNERAAQFIKDYMSANEPEAPETQQPQVSVNYYSGNIVPSPETVFVFGSNTKGIHGAGAAKVAESIFGAKRGVAEGMTGQAYALPTKDLANGERSLTPEQIIENIKHLYQVAKDNPNKQFKVAYRNRANEKTLNGYTGAEMIDMFKQAGEIPSNVYFSQEWVNTGLFDVERTQEAQSTAADGTYEVPAQRFNLSATTLNEALLEYFEIYENQPLDSALREVLHVRKKQISNSKDVLRWIIEKSNNQNWQQLAEFLKPFVDEHPVDIQFNPVVIDNRTSGHTVTHIKQGEIDVGIEMFPNSELFQAHPEQSLLHEITHSVSSAAYTILDTNDETRKNLNSYIDYIKTYLKSNSSLTEDQIDEIYGLSGPTEFIAEFYSNPYFQNILKAIPAMDSNSFNSMFEQFIEWLKNIINIASSRPQNAFEQITPVLSAVLSVQQSIDYNASLAQQFEALLDDQQKTHRFTHPINQIESAIRTWYSSHVANKTESGGINSNGRGYILLSDDKGYSFYAFELSDEYEVTIEFEASPSSKKAKTRMEIINKSIDNSQRLLGSNQEADELFSILRNLGEKLINKCK